MQAEAHNRSHEKWELQTTTLADCTPTGFFYAITQRVLKKVASGDRRLLHYSQRQLLLLFTQGRGHNHDARFPPVVVVRRCIIDTLTIQAVNMWF